MGTTNGSIKHKLIRARIALKHTVEKLLDINKERTKLQKSESKLNQTVELAAEVKLLNRIIRHKVRMIQKYEAVLENERQSA